MSFCLGFALQDIRVTFGVFGVCTVLLLLVRLPSRIAPFVVGADVVRCVI